MRLGKERNISFVIPFTFLREESAHGEGNKILTRLIRKRWRERGGLETGNNVSVRERWCEPFPEYIKGLRNV